MRKGWYWLYLVMLGLVSGCDDPVTNDEAEHLDVVLEDAMPAPGGDGAAGGLDAAFSPIDPPMPPPTTPEEAAAEEADELARQAERLLPENQVKRAFRHGQYIGIVEVTAASAASTDDGSIETTIEFQELHALRGTKPTVVIAPGGVLPDRSVFDSRVVLPSVGGKYLFVAYEREERMALANSLDVTASDEVQSMGVLLDVATLAQIVADDGGAQ